MSTGKDLERKSSAVTLSDMEMFIFPELLYSLVLANIMSPRIWAWRQYPSFAGIEGMNPYRRILKLRQYIMDHYVFNLDLDTWGLTTKERELERFRGFISEDTLSKANVLFGYEGDKYYFDMDIRTHFGLDKYDGSIIPYWKTETVEAMDAFRYKPGYAKGGGECVSLAALYAAALFVVARVPLKDIYLMATPLHSQNFIDVGDGILTNNRRLVTKNMWFNGTALSAQARRALENERVTIVTHETGYVHTIYPTATISAGAYAYFVDRLQGYLKVTLNEDIIANFLRHSRDLQKCFQVRWPLHGVDSYIAAERVFAYEHGSPHRVNRKTRDKLLAEIEQEEFKPAPIRRRIVLNELEDFVRQNTVDFDRAEDLANLEERFASDCLESQLAIEGLAQFCHIEPRLPDPETKEFVSPDRELLGITPGMARAEIIDRLLAIRDRNEMAGLAFYAYRDLGRTEPWPFLLAAVERNPVSIEGTKALDIQTVARKIEALPGESIYDEPGRLAQPDEVWNYGRGDGAEKAVLLANILRSRVPGAEMAVELTRGRAVLTVGPDTYAFPSQKGIGEQVWPIGDYSG
ncbi:MAG: hypothetical protein ABH839_03445 [Chloroflexota bacterium]